MRLMILQQHARRILAHSNKSYYSMFGSYGTISSPEANKTLQSRIKVAIDQKAQIVPVLDQWQLEGNQVKPSDIRGLIKNLLDSNRFSQALEASQWMSEVKACNIFPKDYAARLHLTEKVLGLEEAEKFFNSIPQNMRDYSVYSTVLTCYTRSEKTLDKAESTFNKMRELGFLLKPSPYNSMIYLYTQLGKLNMVEKLQCEMEDNNVKQVLELDSDTINAVAKTIVRDYSQGKAKCKEGKNGEGYRSSGSYTVFCLIPFLIPFLLPILIPFLLPILIPFFMFYNMFF